MLYDDNVHSPIEEMFIHAASKHLDPAADLVNQAAAVTLAGRFVLDFMIQRGGRSVGIECDGKHYHENTLRDECRDALIIGSGKVSVIYRFPGAVLNYSVNEALLALSLWEPSLFSDRGRANLRRLCGDPFRPGAAFHLRNVAVWNWPNEDVVGSQAIAYRHSFPDGHRGPSKVLETFHRFATEVGGGDLDSLMEKWRAADYGSKP